MAVIFLSFFLIPSLSAQSGVFDGTGVIGGRASYSTLPYERVDLFNGNLTLQFLDIFLPGPNGLNVAVWRVYNSKIYKDSQTGQSASIQAEHKSWVGMGWTMHMGRIYDPDSSNPVIEFPDGRRETLYLDNYGTGKYINRDFLKYDKASYKLYFRNGVIWTLGKSTTIYFGDGTSRPARLVTKIENSYGHSITITYKTWYLLTRPVISKIVDSMGREIIFTSTNEAFPRLQKITLKNATGTDVDYLYSVNTFSNGFYRLENFRKPVISACSYQYDDNTYELKKIITEYEGSIEFIYDDHIFNFNGLNLLSRVVAQKKIIFNSGQNPKVWDFTYPDYSGVTEGTTIVAGPEYSVSFTHYGYDSGAPWKIGLIKDWSYNDGSYSESYTWGYQQISNQTWSVFGISMGTVKAPLLSSLETNSTGDASLRTEYLYERSGTKRYGLPTRINHYANGSAGPKYYSELQYYYEDPSRISTWRDVYYMLDYVYSEVKRDGNGQMMAKTQINYFDEPGKRGAIDSIIRYKSDSESYTWDYRYESNNPNWVTITIQDPSGTTTSHKYSYGVESEVSSGNSQLVRNISNYNSAVLSETNQHGGTVTYEYDDLGRITIIVRPDPFNDTSWIWYDGEKRLEIKQGNYVVNKYWDGVGRDIGFVQTGSSLIFYYMKELDSEGRILSENNGSIDPDQKYNYQYDNSGRITRIINPLGKAVNIQFVGRRKTVIDANNRSTYYDYDDLPGLPTKVTDVMGNQSFHTYDPLGRLINVNHIGANDGARLHTYQYDWLGN